MVVSIDRPTKTWDPTFQSYSRGDKLEHVFFDDSHSTGFKAVGILKLIGSRGGKVAFQIWLFFVCSQDES